MGNHFQDKWLEDESVGRFITKDEESDTKYFCKPCNRSFNSVSFQRIKEHLKCERHLKALKKWDPNSEVGAKATRVAKVVFSVVWLERPLCKDWIQPVDDNPHCFYCSVCKVQRSCITGFSNIIRHSKSEIHQLACRNQGIECITEEQEKLYENELSFENRRKIMENKIIQFMSEHHMSVRSTPKLITLMQECAKDPNVLNNLRLSRSKCATLAKQIPSPLSKTKGKAGKLSPKKTKPESKIQIHKNILLNMPTINKEMSTINFGNTQMQMGDEVQENTVYMYIEP